MVWVLYPNSDMVKVYVPADNPWNKTCPGGMHPEVKVKETSFIAGVAVAIFVVK